MQNNDSRYFQQNPSGQAHHSAHAQRGPRYHPYDNRTGNNDAANYNPAGSNTQLQYQQITNDYDPYDQNASFVGSNASGNYHGNPNYPQNQQQNSYQQPYDFTNNSASMAGTSNGSYHQHHHQVATPQYRDNDLMHNTVAVVGPNISSSPVNFNANTNTQVHTGSNRADLTLFSTPNNRDYHTRALSHHSYTPNSINLQPSDRDEVGPGLITDDELTSLTTPELNRRLRRLR